MNRSEAQQARRAREREEAKEQANIQAGAEADAAAEAIPDDAPVEEQTPPKKQETRNASEWRMEALEQLRGRPEDDDEVERQLSDFTEDTPQPTGEATADQPLEEPKAATSEQAQVPAQQPDTVAPAAPATVKVHVNGQEVEVPQAEIDEYGGVRNYQRQKGLEHQIELAKENNKKTYEMMQQMAKLMQAQQAPPAPQKTLMDLAKEKAQAIQFGTPDESAAALTEIVSAASPKVDPQAIIGEAMNAFARKQAADEFCSQNPDIANNKYLSNLMVSIVHDRLSKSPTSDWRKLFADVGEEIRNGVGLPKPTAPTVTTQPLPNPTGSLADKDARKASIVALPVAGARMPAPEEPKPLTREDRLNMMRKGRAQPT